MRIFNRVSWREFDWPLLAAIFLLCAIGFAAIYSVDLSRGSVLLYSKKQLAAFCLGAVFLFLSAFAAPTIFRAYAKWIYAGSIFALIAVLIFGENIRGTTGWFTLSGFSIQPVEFAKIGLILMLAYVASNFGRRFDRPLFFCGTGIITLIPIFLTLLQPDLGSAILLGAIWFGLMWIVGVRKLFLLAFVALFAVVSIIAWLYLLAPYQKDRILNFVDPARDPLGSGYNTVQSVIAVGSGGIFGRGLGFGSQSQLRFLPETQTDFIFSVISEELGMAGVMVILFLYIMIIWRLILIAKRTKDDFTAFVAIGAVILFFSQFFINIGANIGIMPVTGVTLPFVSYGGSSLLANMILVGIIECLNKKNNLSG
jgi:rod shape determining protein RodA